MKIKEEDIILEQYKLYVDTAEKVSDRRQSSNSFYLTLNSVLLTFTGFLTSLYLEFWHIIIAVAGVCISLLWFLSITSFRNLNSGKFKIIHCLEEKLPIKLFKDEWACLEKGRNTKKYIKLSLVEQGVPFIFITLYIVIIILMVLK
jgi:hypothetical protein